MATHLPSLWDVCKPDLKIRVHRDRNPIFEEIMNPLKFLWGMFFRLFPCPIKTGLQCIGNPDRHSPVLVTCNFYITVRRLIRKLNGLNVWLLVADSKGVNVWCAAGGEQLNTHSVVAAIKTSDIADQVDHRDLILPPLGAPGIKASDAEDQTGWKIHWGPVSAHDIPAYLNSSFQRTENMKRVGYNWQDRVDTAIGSLFPFFFIGAIGFLIFGSHLFWQYVLMASATFFLFMLVCPWLPGKTGLMKVAFLEIPLAAMLLGGELFHILNGISMRAELIIAMVMLLVYGSELGGLASNMPSDLDPLLARMGVGAIGNAEFAGSIRTELLNGYRTLTYYRQKCVGCQNCAEICPQGCWIMDQNSRAVFDKKRKCTACRACIVQCQGGAIIAEKEPI
jgi:NAD-dependent dihydropyrimidine dehydrogenase PreA subunit